MNSRGILVYMTNPTNPRWIRSVAGGTFFRFLADGTKEVRFPAIPGVTEEFIIRENPKKS
jgi:hypothetical protein